MREQTVDEHGETIIRINASTNRTLTAEQIEMIERASERPSVYDEECPPMSDELKNRMQRAILLKKQHKAMQITV